MQVAGVKEEKISIEAVTNFTKVSEAHAPVRPCSTSFQQEMEVLQSFGEASAQDKIESVAKNEDISPPMRKT